MTSAPETTSVTARIAQSIREQIGTDLPTITLMNGQIIDIQELARAIAARLGPPKP